MRILFLLLLPLILFSKECSPYFNPDKFLKAPEFLNTLFLNIDIDKKPLEFTIEKKELYRYTPIDIATEVNEYFEQEDGAGGLWRDWNEDAYTITLIPEQVLIKYKTYYLALNVTIEGVKGDATKLNGTIVKYNFYNYSIQVKEHIKCKKGIN